MSFDKRAYWEGMLGEGKRPPATDFVGLDLIAFDETEGWAEAAFCLPAQATNPGGTAQGGFVTAALDEIMSIAGSIVQDGPAMAPTLQMTVSFIRPVPVGQRLIGRGEVVRRGKAGIFTQGFLRDETGKLLAQATASCIPRVLEWK